MAGVSVSRVSKCARIVTGAAIVAAVMTAGGSQSSWAEPPAPIVFARALGPAQPNVRLTNRLEFDVRSGAGPIVRAPSSVNFNDLQGRAEAAPIDLRPGATRTSFGPAPVARQRLELSSTPVSSPASPANFVEPYAGPPYQVEGKWYVPTYEPNYDEVGVASWYGPTFHGKASASGEPFDQYAMTAAHPTLPIPSLVRVTNLENGKSIVVRLNDRGPFVDDRIIDLSEAAGTALGMHAKGTAKVRVQYVGPAPAAPNSQPGTAPVEQVEVSLPLPARAQQPTFVSQPLPPLAPPPANQAPAPANLRGYFLQAGSFADLSNAHTLAAKLQTIGLTSVTSAEVNGATFYRVMVGPWRTNVEALQAQDSLVEKGVRSILVAKLD